MRLPRLPLVMRQLFRRRIVMAATIALVLVVLVSMFAGTLSGFDPNETAVSQRLAQPSTAHLMGTDELGRDLFARIAFGGRYSLTIALLTALGAMMAGTLFGLLVAFNIDVIVPFIERVLHTSFLPASVYLISRMPSEPQRGDIVPIVIISLVLSFVATIYPSWRASRVQPAEALRYE